jgi:plastocyanin
MGSIDKAAIGWSIAIVAVAIGFTAIGSTQPAEILTNLEESKTKFSEAEKKVTQEIEEKTAEMFIEADKQSKEITKESKQIVETTKELVTSKLPARLVSIPSGTSVPGCEKAGKCYDPPNLIIFVGGEIIWRNDDTSAHTVTSGSALQGPDGKFDSSLIRAGDTFSNKFDKKGEFPYFCMIHPWAEAQVTVG